MPLVAAAAGARYVKKRRAAIFPELLTVLTRWRKRLPLRYSLRVGLPAQLVLQQPLSPPELPLKEPALSRFIRAAAQRLSR